MQALKRALLIATALSFALGAWWSWTRARGPSGRDSRNGRAETIRVLAPAGVLSESLLHRFEDETGIRVLIDSVTAADDIWSRILETEPLPINGDETEVGADDDVLGANVKKKSKQGAAVSAALESKVAQSNRLYDVISLFSYQIQAAIDRDRLAVLPLKSMKNADAISIDFVDLPGFRDHERFAPVLWGVNGILLNTTRIRHPYESWADIFEDTSLKGKTTLLGSPADILYVLAHRKSEAEVLAILEREDDGDPDARAEALVRPLQQLALFARMRSENAFPYDVKTSDDLTANEAAVLQLSQGDAASLVGEKDSLKDPWRFIIPTEKAPLWMLAFSIAEGTPRFSAAQRFVDFLLQKESALELVKSTRQASTNRFTEGVSALHPWLKPSHLRSLPLNRIHVIRDFHAGPSLRGILRSTASPSKTSNK